MSSFWGAEVKPGNPYTHTHRPRLGRLRLTQATLGGEPGKVVKGGGGKNNVVQLQCTVKNKDPVFLCALVPGQSETCHLELEFEEKHVTFSVLGPRSIHLAGYYIGDVYGEEIDDGDTGSDSLQGSDDDAFLDTDDDDSGGDDDDTLLIPLSRGSSDGEDDDSEYDSEDDDSEMIYNQPRGKSTVVIEEIQEDDKPAGGGGQKGSDKKQISENGDDSKLQLVVRTPPAESLESEDEDGFPVSFSESKKGTKGNSKKTSNLNKKITAEDRKRKNGAVNDHDSSGEVKDENDGVSKKTKKAKAKKTSVDSVGKESKQEDSPADLVDAKQKKNKKNTSEAGTHQNADKTNHVHNDAEEVTAQEASKKKKNKKKKTQEKNASENQTPKTQEKNASGKQTPTDLTESESKKQPLQTRTFGNGMIVQEIEIGKPDGKKAAPGKKVSVKYIGKLKNGKIFDSTVGRRPFDFRLGIGEVIKGWDVGINGMRVGDKRRITIPPSMGYGNQRAGTIPPNSTLVFDVELVNVK
ncbi:peptidyl-prolyl cis-trans isomerase FKBP53 [Oryza brachyantha]|uniref:peptidylprolyl isomerase n=2 Tax=Magnoliopsida TaxID=3398 RepID=J3LYA2_ORYBR|nr:peptidyl-prolyl cis-trans isomerase FKBP53 [Oryza brachyantha]